MRHIHLQVGQQVVVTGGEGEGERIEDQVGWLQPVPVHRQVMDAVGDLHLPLPRPGLALQARFDARESAVATSGDYMQPFTADSSQHHILDPRTGRSAPDLASSTVAAPNAMMAAEMAVIRLTHVADLPSPEELVRKLQSTPPPPMPGGGQPLPSGTGSGPVGTASAVARSGGQSGGAQAAPAHAPDTALARFPTFDHVVELIRAHREVQLLIEVEKYVRLARYEPGRIEFEPAPGAPPGLAQRGP